MLVKLSPVDPEFLQRFCTGRSLRPPEAPSTYGTFLTTVCYLSGIIAPHSCITLMKSHQDPGEWTLEERPTRAPLSDCMRAAWDHRQSDNEASSSPAAFTLLPLLTLLSPFPFSPRYNPPLSSSLSSHTESLRDVPALASSGANPFPPNRTLKNQLTYASPLPPAPPHPPPSRPNPLPSRLSPAPRRSESGECSRSPNHNVRPDVPRTSNLRPS